MLVLIKATDGKGSLRKEAPLPRPIKLKTRLKRKYPKERFNENDSNFNRVAEPIDEAESNLCVIIWQSTIIQALYDLAADPSSSRNRRIKAEAISWFFVHSSVAENNFDLVCDLACLSRTHVLNAARSVLNEGEKALEGFNFRSIRRECSNRVDTRIINKAKRMRK